MWLIGVDPGLKGAVCAFNVVTREMRMVNNQYDSKKLPTKKFAQEVADLPNASVAIIENVQPQPGWGIKGNATLQRGLGAIAGMLALKTTTTILITPTSWKCQLGLTANKQLSIDTAGLVYPEHRKLFTRDDRAEAALLVDWHLHGDPDLEPDEE